MRGPDSRSGSLISWVDLEDRVPGGHPLRMIRQIANDVPAGMSGAFDVAYAPQARQAPGVKHFPERHWDGSGPSQAGGNPGSGGMRTEHGFHLALAACNLDRMPKRLA